MNILCINLKGGAAKSTISSITASFIENARLIEIDKINQSDSKIKSGDYESIQVDFLNESDNAFAEFEMMLLDETTTNIIDVGAVKLEIFHKAMINSNLYDTLDLIIVPSVDGADDARVSLSYLSTIQDDIDMSKVIFSFNRYNDAEYTNHEEQFDSFFEKKQEIKDNLNIDLDDDSNYFVMKDSRAIKLARKNHVTLKSLIDTDVDEITKQQRSKDITKKERMKLTKKRSLVLNAQNLYKNYIENMMNKIINKLEN